MELLRQFVQRDRALANGIPRNQSEADTDVLGPALATSPEPHAGLTSSRLIPNPFKARILTSLIDVELCPVRTLGRGARQAGRGRRPAPQVDRRAARLDLPDCLSWAVEESLAARAPAQPLPAGDAQHVDRPYRQRSVRAGTAGDARGDAAAHRPPCRLPAPGCQATDAGEPAAAACAGA